MSNPVNRLPCGCGNDEDPAAALFMIVLFLAVVVSVLGGIAS